MKLNFGRIGPGANGKFTLGKLECSGRTTLTSMPTNCYDLSIVGQQINGFFTVKGSSTQLVIVYCDFNKASNYVGTLIFNCFYQKKNQKINKNKLICCLLFLTLTGYETRIGYVDVKTNSGVYFYVQKTSSYSTNQSVIPYQIERLNIGHSMNLTNGVFTVPTNGRYHFNFKAQAGDASSGVYLRLNGVEIAESFGVSEDDMMPLTVTVNLKKEDRIDTFLWGGSINDNSVDHYTQFSGILLEEDLIL